MNVPLFRNYILENDPDSDVSLIWQICALEGLDTNRCVREYGDDTYVQLQNRLAQLELVDEICQQRSDMTAQACEDHFSDKSFGRLHSELEHQTPREVIALEQKYNIEVYSYDGRYPQDQLRTIDSVFGLLPDEIRRKLFDGYPYQIILNTPQEECSETLTSSGCTTRGGTIYMVTGCKPGSTIACQGFASTLVHEVIHNLDEGSMQSAFCAPRETCPPLDAFANALSEDGIVFTGTDSPPEALNGNLPYYFEEEHYWTDKEAFAEIGSLYIYETEGVRETAPHTYDFFQEYFYDGMEYDYVCRGGEPVCRFSAPSNQYICEEFDIYSVPCHIESQ